MRLDDTTALPDGTRLRVRLPHARDREAIRALHAHLGIVADDLEIGRLLRFDPRRRTTLCATVWDGAAERVVAYAAAERGSGDVTTVVSDEMRAPGAGAVLRAAVADDARAA